MSFSSLKTNTPREWSVFLLFALCASYGLVSGGAWAIFAFVLGGLAVGFFFWKERKCPHLSKSVLQLFLAMLLLFALSVALTGFSQASVKTFVKMAGISIPLMVLMSSAGRLKTFPFIPISLCLVFGFLLYDGTMLYVAHDPDVLDKPRVLAKYNRGFSYALLFVLPLFAGLWQRWSRDGGYRHVLIVLALALLSALLMTHSRAAQAGFFLSMLVLLWGARWPRATFSLVALASFLGFLWPLMAPGIYSYLPEIADKLPVSWQARLEIWDYTARPILDQGLLGVGLGQTRLLPVISPFQELYQVTFTPAAHPHNMIIQILLELGLAGAALLAAFLWVLLRKIASFPKEIRIFAMAAYVYAYWISCVAYNFWTDSLWVAFVLTILAFNHVEKNEN